MTQDRYGKDKILLICPAGYDRDIKKAFEGLGYEVDAVSDKPNDGFVCKAAVRLNLKAYRGVIGRYHRELIRERAGCNYAVIVSVRGEFLDEATLERYRVAFPQSKLILYMWDSLKNYPLMENRLKCYDRAFTFDRADAENCKSLCFRPLFFTESFRGSKKESAEKRYALSFIGTAHSDRPYIMNEIRQQCDAAGELCFEYWFQPFSVLYYFNRLQNQDFKYLKRGSVNNVLLPKQDTSRILLSSYGTVDAEHPSQVGLTMRTIESLGMRIKLLTTNKDVVNYDFFSPENIMVIDRNKPKVDFSFLKSPYVDIPQHVYERYSINGWAKEILK